MYWWPPRSTSAYSTFYASVLLLVHTLWTRLCVRARSGTAPHSVGGKLRTTLAGWTDPF